MRRWFPLLLLFFGVLYLWNLAGWVMDDDEGTDWYEVWMIQMGAIPGPEFAAEQQPLFLLAGAMVLPSDAVNPAPLRFMNVVQVLAGAAALLLVVRRVWGERTAELAAVLLLASGLVFQQARLWRPDGPMLGWEMAGLAAALLAVHDGDRRAWALSGACYGVAMLWKPFAVFAVAGLAVYLLASLRRRGWRETLYDGAAFAAPYLLITVGISALLYSTMGGFYWAEPLAGHWSLGRGNPVWDRFRWSAWYLWNLGISHPALLLTLPLWLVGWRRLAGYETRLLACQWGGMLGLLVISRPLYIRYWLWLIPALAVLGAVALVQRWPRAWERGWSVPALLAGCLVFSWPWIPALSSRVEHDSLALARTVAARTTTDDIVLSDYPTLNVMARRRSIPEASVIAGASMRTGVMTADHLVQAIEELQIPVVLVHVAGGEPAPHHMVAMPSYPEFRAYLQDKFTLARTFDRAGQLIEVWESP